MPWRGDTQAVKFCKCEQKGWEEIGLLNENIRSSLTNKWNGDKL